MKPAARRIGEGLLGLALLLLASCGSDRKPVYPVRGKVLFQGKPTPGALVIFHPLDSSDDRPLRSSGRVEADGSFQLSTYRTHDGAHAGRYAVTILWPSPPAGPDAGDLGPDRLKGRYSDPKHSPWQVEIRPESNDLETFQLR